MIPLTITSQLVIPLSTTRVSFPASTIYTTKDKVQISKRKNDVPASQSWKKQHIGKKGVRQGTTSSQVDFAKDEFMDLWNKQINFKKYKEI